MTDLAHDFGGLPGPVSLDARCQQSPPLRTKPFTPR